jgi:hypothetical protein
MFTRSPKLYKASLRFDFQSKTPRTIGTVIRAAMSKAASIPTITFFLVDHLRK